MKIFSIGNSFSVDAHAWLHETARAQGVELTLGNLFIGGCSLERHDQCIRENLADYVYFKTGREERPATVADALAEEKWDIITVQQASHFSGISASYQPYLARIAEYVRARQPQARLMVHQTWAYESDSTHAGFARYNREQAFMYACLKNAYEEAARFLDAEIIPCGDAMQLARKMSPFDYAAGGLALTRDGFHASLTHGRYLLSCVWLETLTGLSCLNNTFVPALAEQGELTPTEEELTCLRQAAHQAVVARR